MLPSSDVRILDQTTDRMVVLVPPYYSAAFFLCLFAGVILIFLLISSRGQSSSTTRFVMGGIVVIELLLALLLGTYKTVVTLSHSNDSVRILRSVLGITISNKTLVLHEVDAFGTSTSVGSAIEAVLRNGAQVSITSSVTNQGGYTSAIHAMNQFLNHGAAQ